MNIEEKYKICKIYWIITFAVTVIYVGVYEKDFWNYLLLKEKGEIVYAEIQSVNYKKAIRFSLIPQFCVSIMGKQLQGKYLRPERKKKEC